MVSRAAMGGCKKTGKLICGGHRSLYSKCGPVHEGL